jgi:hypothetical protein
MLKVPYIEEEQGYIGSFYIIQYAGDIHVK